MRLSEIPTPYLVWVAREANIEEWLERAVEMELEMRSRGQQQYQAPPTEHRRIPAGVSLEVALRLVETGRRSMARTAHPDAGGNHTDMASVNATSDWLSEHMTRIFGEAR